jgi:hypothetical protein
VLAYEIKRRGLKFADTLPGQYEMLSDEELDLIVDALRSYLIIDALRS